MLPYKESLPIYRSTSGGDTNIYPDAPSHYEYLFIQPQDPTLVLTDASYSKTFRAYAELGANLQDMDQVIHDGKTLRISGIQNFKFGGHAHLEITLEQVY